MDNITPKSPRKRRYSKACTRCRKRKIRCDFQHPICGACLSAGASCLGFDSVNETDKPRNTISHLQNEVARLELELRRVKTHSRTKLDIANTAVETLTAGLARAISEPGGRSRKQKPFFPLTSKFFLSGSPVPYLSMQIGTDSNNTHTQVKDAPPRPIAISLIPRHVIDIMLKNYCEIYRSRYPAIEEADLYEACDRVYRNAEPSGFDCFCTYITLAISANTLMHHDEKKASLVSSGFWASAIVHLTQIGLANSWERLQALQLLTHYGFLNPRDVDCSKCAAAATRLCFELGLHHELPVVSQVKLGSPAVNTRRRLFLNSYSIDSAVHSVRCRPFVMPEYTFTAKFPASDAKSSPGIHVFLLRQIESEITIILYYPTLSFEDTVSDSTFDQWHTRMHGRVNEWYQATRQSVSLTEKIEFHELFFHAQMLRLNRPSPRCPNPTKEMTQKALKASISLIKEFIVISRLKKLFNVWHAAYHIVESGVCLMAFVLTAMTSMTDDTTYLEGQDVSILTKYIRACSQLLPQVSRRWSDITQHASALEAISLSLLDKLQQWASGQVLESADFHELSQKLKQVSLFSPFSSEALAPSEGSVLPEQNYVSIEEMAGPNQIITQSGPNDSSDITIAEQYSQLAATTDPMVMEQYTMSNTTDVQAPNIQAESFNSGWISSEPISEYNLDMFPEPFGFGVEVPLQWDFGGLGSEEIFVALLEGGEDHLAENSVGDLGP